MNCPKCQLEYNGANRKPQKLPCDHLCCLKCIYKMKKGNQVVCCIDNKAFENHENFPIQQQYLSQLQEEKSKLETINMIQDKISNIKGKFDYDYKIITIGSISTGKTCMLQKYFRNLFQPTEPTISIDFFTKYFSYMEKNIFVTAVDTAGAENYKCLQHQYVKDKHCIILTFDITSRKTFDDIDNWIEWANEMKDENTFYVLVGNKSDLETQRQITKEEAQKYAIQNQMPYFEVSSKTGFNIEKLFEYCIIQCYKTFQQTQNQDVFHVENKKQKKRDCFSWFRSLFSKQFR